jgi:hypothetical protein
MSISYVVSEDIQLLLRGWAKEKGFTLPPLSFFRNLRSKLRDKLGQIFSQVDFANEGDLQRGLSELLSTSRLPIVSLEKVYVNSHLNLELTRQVHELGREEGLVNRFGTRSLKEQVTSLKAMLPNNNRIEVALVDDVIFSGSLMMNVIKILAEKNVAVVEVYAGVGVGPGVKPLRDQGLLVRCVYEYQAVIDQICERDFYPGVPFSGRLVEGSEDLGFPYLKPFGKTGEWASIPSSCQEDFSEFCWRQTAALFSEIEFCSQRKVLCRDLGRFVLDFPTDDTNYVKTIESRLQHDYLNHVFVYFYCDRHSGE